MTVKTALRRLGAHQRIPLSQAIVPF